MKTIFCSVITKNYIALARAMVQSLVRHNPLAKCAVLIVDDVENVITCSEEGFEILRLSDLNLPDTNSFAFQYDAVELSNSLKPFLIRYLQNRAKGCSIIYLDSDLLILDSISELSNQAASGSVLLTVHAFSDYAANGPFHRTEMLFTYGIYNAGLIGVGASAEAERFLGWWCSKLLHDCIGDRQNGLCHDQRYLDCVPAHFHSVQICSDIGVNVGHFNLHERRIRREGPNWLVDDEPLRVFHGTQIDLDRRCFAIDAMNAYLENPALCELIEHFAHSVERAGWKETRGWPYSFATFDDGTPIAYSTRVAFREAFRVGDVEGDPFKSDRWLEFQIRREREERTERRVKRLLKRVEPLAAKTVRAIEQICGNAWKVR